MKYEAKIITLKLKAKELLQNGKTKEAKKILGEVARMQKQLEVNLHIFRKYKQEESLFKDSMKQYKLINWIDK